MHESDLVAEDPQARLRVDQLGALPGERGDRRPHIVDLVRDVVHAGAVLCEKPADGRIVAERGEQLDAPVADPDRGRLDPLLLETGTVLEPSAEQTLVALHRLVEVRNRQADVVDSAYLHTSDAM